MKRYWLVTVAKPRPNLAGGPEGPQSELVARLLKSADILDNYKLRILGKPGSKEIVDDMTVVSTAVRDAAKRLKGIGSTWNVGHAISKEVMQSPAAEIIIITALRGMRERMAEDIYESSAARISARTDRDRGMTYLNLEVSLGDALSQGSYDKDLPGVLAAMKASQVS